MGGPTLSTGRAKRSLAELAVLLDELATDVDRPPRDADVPMRVTRKLFTVGSALVALALLVALPFLVFVRVSVLAYATVGFPTWLAVGAGALTTVLLLTAYGATISKRLTGRARIRMLAKRVALPLVICYCGYGLWYLSGMNAKTEAVRSHYTALHPLVRIAVGTILLVDRDLVLTDVHRTPQDYVEMGLPSRQESLHYEQRDGFVHAVDLRTMGRAQSRNWLMQLYFRAMGFGTLRHVGTADHLHVTLPPRKT